MGRNKRKVTASVVLAVAALIVASIAWASSTWSAAGAGLSVKMTSTAADFRVVYNLNVENPSNTDIGNIYLAGKIPDGASFVEITATPAGAVAIGKQADNTVAWTISGVKAGAKIGPFSYKVSVSGQTAGTANAWVRWTSPSEGSALSDNQVSFAEVAIDGPKRGCESCHALRDANTGSVTIAYEAKVRGGANHPKLGWETTVDQCLTCHAPGTGSRENMGVSAPKMLRDIVHPAHMNSPSFTGTYKGNCFTCHNVDGAGRFTLLGSKLKTDFRGIPKEVPVKGILPSGS